MCYSPADLAAQLNSDVQTWTTAGTGWDAYSDALGALAISVEKGDILYPDAQDIVVLAGHEWAAGNTVAVENSSPCICVITLRGRNCLGESSRPTH